LRKDYEKLFGAKFKVKRGRGHSSNPSFGRARGRGPEKKLRGPGFCQGAQGQKERTFPGHRSGELPPSQEPPRATEEKAERELKKIPKKFDATREKRDKKTK